MSHAARMDRVYAGQRHIYDLTRKYYLLGRDRLIAGLAPPPGGTVLEIGCGTARNLIAAAKAWPKARCFGIDISTEMLTTAHTNIARAGLSDRITLAAGDATDFDAAVLFGVPTFDRVVMSYTLSMIPDWRGAVARAAQVVAPGGRIEIVDFGQQERLPAPLRHALFAWLARFHVSPRADLPVVVERLGRISGLEAGWVPLYRGYAWSITLTRQATVRPN